MSKADYVRSQGQERDHHCHWPGCPIQVPPARWGCQPHWYRLPANLRTRIWRAYRPGQEKDLKPSPEYRIVATEVMAWIFKNDPEVAKQAALDFAPLPPSRRAADPIAREQQYQAGIESCLRQGYLEPTGAFDDAGRPLYRSTAAGDEFGRRVERWRVS